MMPVLVNILATPLGIFLSIIFAFILANVFRVSWSILIPIYIIIAVLITVYAKSSKGQKEMAERDKRIARIREKESADRLERAKEAEQAAQRLEEERQAAQEEEEEAFRKILVIETSPLQNLQTNLAELAIEELAKVDARLSVSVNLKDFPSVVAPAVFAVNQFKNSEDYTASLYLSQNIWTTCYIYQTLQECFRFKIDRINKSSGGIVFTDIGGQSDLGKLIGAVLTEEPKDWSGSYKYDQVIQSLMQEASNKLVKLNELLQTMRQISRSKNISNSNVVSTSDPFEQITKLKKLKDEGIITESEFELKKKDLIDRM